MRRLSIPILLLAPALTLAATGFAGTRDAEGWTVLAPSADSRLIHVSSSSGSDANSGLSASEPLETLAAGVAKLRDGYPDHLLLKRGDTWVDQSLGDFRRSGRSADEPLVIGAYGPLSADRPYVQTGGDNFITVWNGSRSHIAIVGIRMRGHRWDGTQSERCSGIHWIGVPGENVLIEDCLIENYSGGMGFTAPSGQVLRNVIVRRCVVADVFAISGRSYSNGNDHSQGIYASNVTGMLVEESVFDRCGWNPSVVGAQRTIYNHDLYLQYNCRELVVRGNIHSRGASDVIQCRPGGTIEDNLIVRCPIGGWTGIAHRGAPMPSRIRHNVVLEGNDISDSLPRGSGLMMKRSPDGEIAHNIVSTEISDWSHYAIKLTMAQESGYPVSLDRPTRMHDNIVWRWGTGGSGSGSGYKLSDIAAGELERSNNQEDGTVLETGATVSYPDPDRDLADYQASLGESASFAAFIVEARRQRRGYWRRAYTAIAVGDYVRAGFGRPARGPTPEPAIRRLGFTATRGGSTLSTTLEVLVGGSPVDTSGAAGSHSVDDLDPADTHRLAPGGPAASG